jgi:general secretion pathway protein E
MMNDGFFQQFALRNGLISEEKLVELQEKRKDVGASMFELALQTNVLNETSFAMALAREIGLGFIPRIDRASVPQQLLTLIPINFARAHRCIPVHEAEDRVVVALADPLSMESVDDLKTFLGKPVDVVVAPSEEINAAINDLYERAGAGDELGEKDKKDEEELTDILDLQDEAPIIRWVNNLFARAARERASDIHIEPTEKEVLVRYRIDGILYNVKEAPRAYLPSIISRVKIMAGLNIAEKRLPQDGRISLKIAGKSIDVRVSTIPTSQGERAVLRLLDKSTVLLDLTDLGFSRSTYAIMDDLITRPHGIILVTGPTGCGKTTTLYGALSKINKPDLNILTVEDPVEYDIKGINQMQVNPKIDLTFATGLRSFLRQDPDVIMVGEVRDRETAEIAIHASLTGHLVLSTIHTNDASGALTRLVEMGVEPFLVASSMLAIMAQRLVRVLCKTCREPFHPSDEQLAQIGLTHEKIADFWREKPATKYAHAGARLEDAPAWLGKELTVYRAKGCDKCSFLGYRGRTGIYELLLITDKVRALVLDKEDSNTIKRAAIAEGMLTLRDDGGLKVLQGITTLEEVARVTQEEIM